MLRDRVSNSTTGARPRSLQAGGDMAHSFATRRRQSAHTIPVSLPSSLLQSMNLITLRLGLMMDVLHGANLSAGLTGLTYILGFGNSSKLQPARRPSMMRRAVWILVLLLGLAYACAGCETWLSVSSKSVLFTERKPYRGDWPLLSTQVNQTLCNEHGDAYEAGINFCGLEFNQYVTQSGVQLS